MRRPAPGRSQTLSARHPLLEVGRNEFIICQMWIRAADAIDFGGLPGAECFAVIQASCARQQTLTPQDLLDAGDAAGKAVSRVEERTIRVRGLNTLCEKRRRHLLSIRRHVTLV